MRVLQIGLGGGCTLDLHPAASVVTVLSDLQRTTLRQAFRAVGAGLEPDVPALLEAHGVLLDATQADLDLLDVPLAPTSTVATPAEVPGAVGEAVAVQLRHLEQDLLALAAARARTGPEPGGDAGPATVTTDHARLRARAASLHARIARYGASEAEPVQAALDRIRDQRPARGTSAADGVVEALSGIGLDLGDLGLPEAELVRIAEDWLDERRREAAALVGVEVELRGIDEALARPEPDRDDTTGPEARRARADRAAAAHAEAVERLDRLHAAARHQHHPGPRAPELEAHLLARLADHRPARLAGAVPLLLDGVFEHLDPEDVTAVLDRLAGLAGTVQLVVVDAHPAVEAWAQAVGIRRAAVVEPAAGTPAGPAA